MLPDSLFESKGAFDHNEFSTKGDNGVGGVPDNLGDIGHAEASLDLGDLRLEIPPRGVLKGDGGVHILGSISSRL